MPTILVYLDTSCVNAKQKIVAMNKLERLNDEEKIMVEITDTFETELRSGKGYPRGLAKVTSYIFSEGPAVIGHSRVGSCIVGSEEDDKRLSRILELLFGKKLRKEYFSNEIRDAMHVSTAIHYGGTYFITLDKKVLKAFKKVKREFQIVITTPEECLRQIKTKLNL